MSKKLSPKLKEKQWSSKIEKEILQYWTENKFYALDKKTKKPIFCVDTPPPYCSGSWHVGGAIHYTQIDMIARYMRMLGYEVRFPMATDRNGLPIEVQVEKAYNISMYDVPREQFLNMCKGFLDKYEKEIISLAERLGLSCNGFDDKEIVRTDSPEYRAITQATFIELWNRGLIYEDVRANNWCPGCKTTLSDAEIEYREEATKLYYIKFKVKDANEPLTIATTRPELLGACKAIIVHPDDSRYIKYHNKTAIVPIYNREIKIIPHKEAKMDFGTGAVMICSYGDYTDVRLFRELKLDPIIMITPEGTLTEAAGKYAGLTVKDARKSIVEDLQKQNLLVKEEEIVHRQPICWRSKDPIEYIPMKEFYLKQIDFVEDLRKIVDSIKFHPPESKQILLNWLDSITKDWPISRRRYYGTEIPVWYCKSCGKPVVPPPGKYYQPWKEDPPLEKCPHCGSPEGFIGEWRTFDTWMDSSITPLQYLFYLRDNEFFKKAFPCSLRPQGKDIVRTWLYYTLLRVYQLTKMPAFRHVWIGGMIVDEKGEAMHKSKGNVVWPVPIIEKYGSDALRLFGCLEASHGSDIRYSEEHLKGTYRFLTKLWNIARFVSAFPVVDKPLALNTTDKWILGELNNLIKRCKVGYDEFDFHIPAVEVRNFVWNLFASHYIEMVKARAYRRSDKFSSNDQKSAWYTLHAILKTILKLLAPITPFITEKIYVELYSSPSVNESVHLQTFPEENELWETKLINLTEKLVEANSLIWKAKKDANMSLKEKLTEGWIPKDLKPFARDIQEMHHIEKLEFGEPTNKNAYVINEGKAVTLYIKI